MKTRAAIFEPCIGIGGGDGFCSSLVAAATSIDWTIFVEAWHAPERYESALHRSAGRATFFSVKPKKHKPADLSPLVNWFDHADEAALAAAAGADVVLSWHCRATPIVADRIDRPIVELVQNEDNQARHCGRAATYAYQRVAVSEAAGKWCYEDLAFKVIPNGVEADRCTPAIGRESQRQLWNVAGDEVVCLFAGRFSDEKNAEAIIDALEVLPENFTALFVGEGLQYEQLARRAMRSASGRCRFLPSRPQLGDCFAAADVFVLPSDCEGDSLAMKEAFIAGIPVVATLAGSVREIYSQFGPIMKVVPVRPRREELAGAIAEASKESPLNLAHISAIALKNFAISRIAREWEGFLETIAFEERKRREERDFNGRMQSLQSTPIRHVIDVRDLRS